jgi:hypothetical protein
MESGGPATVIDRLLSVTFGMSLLLIAAVLFSVRRSHIRVEYSVSWLVAGFVMLVLSRSTFALETIAALLGIQYAPAALLLIILSLFLIVFFRFSIVISDLKDANIALTQKLAILEYRIQNINEESKKETLY